MRIPLRTLALVPLLVLLFVSSYATADECTTVASTQALVCNGQVYRQVAESELTPEERLAAAAQQNLPAADSFTVRKARWWGRAFNYLLSKRDSSTPQLQSANPVDDKVPAGSSLFFTYLGVSAGLIVMGGIMSGMTIGLFALDPVRLQILQRDESSNPEDRERAATLLPILSNHHLLLVTLLVVNSACMEALPVFLEKVMADYLAVLTSVTFVLLFGEILPQAWCTKNPLKIGARFAPLIKLLIFIFWPLCYPISRLLDFIIGTDRATHGAPPSQQTLSQPEVPQVELFPADESAAAASNYLDESAVLKAAELLKNKRVEDCMVPFDNIFSLDGDAPVNNDVLTEIQAHGHTRVPVFVGRRNNLSALLPVKSLVKAGSTRDRKIKDFASRRPIVLHPDSAVFDALHDLQRAKAHVALVTVQVDQIQEALISDRRIPEGAEILGIVTLEDLLGGLFRPDMASRMEKATDLRTGHLSDPASLILFSLQRMVQRFKDRSVADSVTDEKDAAYRRDQNVRLARGASDASARSSLSAVSPSPLSALDHGEDGGEFAAADPKSRLLSARSQSDD